MEKIKDIPSLFTIQARNSNHNVTIGDGFPVFAPGYGAPFLIDPEVGKRVPTIQDYRESGPAGPHAAQSGYERPSAGRTPGHPSGN